MSIRSEGPAINTDISKSLTISSQTKKIFDKRKENRKISLKIIDIII